MAAMTPAEIAALDSFTNAEMAKLLRWAINGLTADKTSSYTVAGRSYTFHDLDKLRTLERGYLKDAAVDAANTAAATSGCPVVNYGEIS